MKIAVIGAGHLGRIHAKLIREHESATLHSIVDPNREAAAGIANEYHVGCVSDYCEVIDEIDAAIVATPTRSHHEIASTLLDSGVHVLVEKPMTHTAEQAADLVRIADQRKLTLQVGHVERFNPVFEQIRTKVKSPRYIQSARCSTYTFRSTDVGVVHDLMIHDVDLVLSLVRSEVTNVRATGVTLFGGHEDIAQARIEFANGCVANLEASRASFEPKRAMQVFAEQGWYQLDFAACEFSSVEPSLEVRLGTHGFAGMNAEQQAVARDELFTRYLPHNTRKIEQHNAILCEQADFLECIATGKAPRVSAEDGCEAVKVCDMILEQVAASEQPAKKSQAPVRESEQPIRIFKAA